MKAIINSLKKNQWFKASVAFLTCLLFLSFPSCQKDELNLDPALKMDFMSTKTLTTNSQVAYYGPKTFIRGKGDPFLVTEKIENPDFDKFNNNFILKIQNGRDKKTRVSSAEIWIDGVLVVGPSDFSKNVSFITKPLSGLTPESVLEVKLNSAPGSFLDLWIEGTLREEVTDIDGDGFSISQGDCNDNDPSINPAATEICDQKDNDCDGEIDEYINIAPVANAGGPYILHSGTNLVINGSQSRDANAPCDYIVSYLWDVDNDGLYDDASGEIVTLTWEQLIAIFGFPPRVGMTYGIELMVTDRTGISAIVETTLIIYS